MGGGVTLREAVRRCSSKVKDEHCGDEQRELQAPIVVLLKLSIPLAHARWCKLLSIVHCIVSPLALFFCFQGSILPDSASLCFQFSNFDSSTNSRPCTFWRLLWAWFLPSY
jgi:hypothetical protein